MNTIWDIRWLDKDGAPLGNCTFKGTETNALCYAARMLTGVAVCVVFMSHGDKLFTFRRN